MQVNGKQELEAAGMTLAEYIEKKQYRTDRIAVELNGQIIPKAQYAQTVLTQEDVLEVVSFVGGG